MKRRDFLQGSALGLVAGSTLAPGLVRDCPRVGMEWPSMAETGNGFTVRGRTLIGYGGSQSLDRPRRYSNVARRLIAEIGIQPERFFDYFDGDFNQRHGMTNGLLFSAALSVNRDRFANSFGLVAYGCTRRRSRLSKPR